MTTPVESHITPDTLLSPAIQAWQYYLNDQGRSLFTVKAFIGDLNLMASYFPPDTSIGSVTTEQINRFLDWMQNERPVPCSPKSYSRRITSIKAFFRWLTQSGRLTTDPAEKVLQQSVISPLPEVLTSEEQEKILKVAQDQFEGAKSDDRPLALLRLLLETGIKKGECLALNTNHLELEDEAAPFLFVRYPSNNSRYKERKIPLSKRWVEIYRVYQAQYKPIDQVFPWSPRRLEYLLEDIGVAAGLNKHLSFDMCRWTSALNDWVAGEDPDTIRQKLGISKIQWREISNKLKQLAENQH